MARYKTRKATPKAKHETCCRKTTRTSKYASPALDIPRLERELCDTQRLRDAGLLPRWADPIGGVR